MSRLLMPLSVTNILLACGLHDITSGLVEMVRGQPTPGSGVLAGVLMILLMLLCKQIGVWRTGSCVPLVTTQEEL